VNVTCGEDFSLTEYQEIIDLITSKAADDAHIIAGVVTDSSLKDEVRVTVIATGFGAARQKPAEKQANHGGMAMPLGLAGKTSEFLGPDEWPLREDRTPQERDKPASSSPYGKMSFETDRETDEFDIPTALRSRRVAPEDFGGRR
jgi:cell division protein FtsZ